MIAEDSLRRIAAWSRGLNEREIDIARAGIVEKSFVTGEFIFARGDTPAEVEASLREAQSLLEVDITPT